MPRDDTPAAEPNLRARLRDWTERPAFRYTILGLIAFNAITLGLETVPNVTAVAGGLLTTIDHAVLAIFVVEIGIRIYAHGPRFFRDPWGVFDFVIVAVALTPASDLT